ncbi:MAG: PTS sugar transporter subunit IIA [Planctomycetota bacterium]|jgi:mannitol/fructose-specific phosphotransferase system IIA component (Ntr-type)
MKLNELLRTECIKANSLADDKALALCEVAALAKESDQLRDVTEEQILEGLQEREILGTTAFGEGVAIPHCRLRDVKDFVVGIMSVPGGVEFEAPDGKKVQLIVFIIAPRQESNTHIRLLSAISRALQNGSAVQKMIAAKDAQSLHTAFLEAAAQDISERVPLRRNLINVFVQDENVFRHVIEQISGLEGISFSVIEGQNCRPYLSNLPLYAGFAEIEDNRVCKILAVIVERRLSNEVIRRIETVTGNLFECTGVMVTVQELTYSAGSLEV